MFCSFPPPDGKDSLRSLCLVSHQTLPSARRALYYRPFSDFFLRRNLWRSASTLLHTLEKEGGLGQLVRDTNGIRNWLGSMDLQAFERHEPPRKIAVWYFRILRACPRLEQVDFGFETEDDLSIVVRALHLGPPSLNTDSYSDPSSIRSIRLMTFPSGHISDVKEVLEALKRSPLRRLETLEIDRASQFESRNCNSPQLPFPIRNIKIKASFETMDSWFGFFPRTPSNLEHFSYNGFPRWEDTDLQELSTILGTNLKSLSLEFRRYPQHGFIRFSPALPFTAFVSLPHLNSLTLCNAHGPSLRLLETLAQFSPLLSDISFKGSHWVADSSRHSILPNDIFPSTQVIATLRHFRHLRSINLGHLPTRDALEYTFMEIQEQGVAVLWAPDDRAAI